MWESKVRLTKPYVPGEQPNNQNMVKLNTNECPYPPGEGVKKILETMDIEKLRLYPDPDVSLLVQKLAQYYKKDEAQIFVGVGSDDVLAMAFLTFFHGKEPILFPEISYSFYEVWANLFRIPYEKVPLRESFLLDVKDYQRVNGGILFPNPNAPTGVAIPVSDIEELLKQNTDSVVIVDEAYVDFGAESCMHLVDQYENLLVVQTFSKSRAMAGMRIGFAVGSKKLIGYLKNTKFAFNSYTMNLPSILCGKATLEEEDYFQSILEKIIQTREWTQIELEALGFSLTDSKANFVFATHPKYQAKELLQVLRKEGVYVRHFDIVGIDDYLRISIGTREEMERMLTVLRGYIK